MSLVKIIMCFYGNDFNDVKPLYVLMISTIFMSFCNVVGQVIASEDKMWLGVLFNAIWACWVILFSFFFRTYGATGLALTILISYALHFFAQSLYIKFRLKHKFS